MLLYKGTLDKEAKPNTNLTLYWLIHFYFSLTICPFTFPYRKLHQQFESYKDQVKKMGEESKQTQDQKSEAPTCGICHKTKFADGCGHLCSYCQTKFCARCGGRVSLRSNKVTLARMIGTFHLLGHIYTHTHMQMLMPHPEANFSLCYDLKSEVMKHCSEIIIWELSQQCL